MSKEKIEEEFISFTLGIGRMRLGCGYVVSILIIVSLGLLMDHHYITSLTCLAVAITLVIISYCKRRAYGEEKAETRHNDLLQHHKAEVQTEIEYIRQLIIENINCAKAEEINTRYFENNIKDILGNCPSEIKEELAHYVSYEMGKRIIYQKGGYSRNKVKLFNARFEELAAELSGQKDEPL